MKLSDHEQKVAIKHLECAIECCKGAIEVLPFGSRDAEEIHGCKNTLELQLENVRNNDVV